MKLRYLGGATPSLVKDGWLGGMPFEATEDEARELFANHPGCFERITERAVAAPEHDRMVKAPQNKRGAK